MDAGRGDGRRRAIARQRHADCFGQAVHGVRGVHTGARAAARAGVTLGVVQGGVVDDARLIGADRLEGLGQRNLVAAEMTGEHRAARYQNRGDVQARRSHQHAGHDLVTVRDQHQTVELVRLRQRLDRVRDQLAGSERILHADVAHGDAVAYTDGRDEDGRAARHGNAGLDGGGDLIEVDMTGDDLAVRGDNADDRAVHLLIGHTAGAQQRTVRHALRALCDVVTSSGHRDSLL